MEETHNNFPLGPKTDKTACASVLNYSLSHENFGTFSWDVKIFNKKLIKWQYIPMLFSDLVTQCSLYQILMCFWIGNGDIIVIFIIIDG